MSKCEICNKEVSELYPIELNGDAIYLSVCESCADANDRED